MRSQRVVGLERPLFLSDEERDHVFLAAARTEVAARLFERLAAVGPDLVDARGEQAQEGSVQSLETAGAVFRDVLEGHTGETRQEQCCQAPHDVGLLQRQHHLLWPEGDPGAQDAEETCRAGPSRQGVAVRDEMNPLPEPGGDPVREIASAAAESEHCQVVPLKCVVLDERQKPVLGAPRIEPVHHIENAHAMLPPQPIRGGGRQPSAMVRLDATIAAAHATAA